MFWFRVALALGMSVKRAQEEVDSREFAHWVAFYNLEPFGDVRGDLQAAMGAHTTAAYMRGSGTPVPSFETFVLQFEKKAQTVDEMKHVLGAALGYKG